MALRVNGMLRANGSTESIFNKTPDGLALILRQLPHRIVKIVLLQSVQ